VTRIDAGSWPKHVETYYALRIRRICSSAARGLRRDRWAFDSKRPLLPYAFVNGVRNKAGRTPIARRGERGDGFGDRIAHHVFGGREGRRREHDEMGLSCGEREKRKGGRQHTGWTKTWFAACANWCSETRAARTPGYVRGRGMEGGAVVTDSAASAIGAACAAWHTDEPCNRATCELWGEGCGLLGAPRDSAVQQGSLRARRLSRQVEKRARYTYVRRTLCCNRTKVLTRGCSSAEGAVPSATTNRKATECGTALSERSPCIGRHFLTSGDSSGLSRIE
jgi:hypothetical protein